MKIKQLISSVTAAAILMTSAIADLPPLQGVGQTAYAAATESFVHSFANDMFTITVKQGSEGLEAKYSQDLTVEGVTSETTVRDLVGMYSTISVEGFSFINSDIEGLTADDISLSVSVLSGDSWDGWDESYSEVLDLSAVNEANLDKVVRAITFHVKINADAIERLGLESGDIITLNKSADATMIECVYNGAPLVVTMGAAEAEGTFWGCATYQFDVEGLKPGSTTFAELKALADGISITGWEVNGSTLEGLDPGDLTVGVLLVTGLDFRWNSTTKTTAMFSEFDIADDTVINAIQLQVSLYDGGKYGFSNGDKFTINPIENVEEWNANFVYNEETGDLSWDNYQGKACSNYGVYANGQYLAWAGSYDWGGGVSTPSINLIRDLAYKNYTTNNSMVGDLTINVKGNYDGFEYTTADSFEYHCDGTVISDEVTAPSNITVDPDGTRLIWDGPDNAMGYLAKWNDGDEKKMVTCFFNECTTFIDFIADADYGTYVFEAATIDPSGNISEFTSYTYTKEASVEEWEANFVYDDTTGDLSWDNATDVLTGKALGYDVFADGYNIGSAFVFDVGIEDSSPHFNLPLQLANYNIKNDNILTGELDITVSIMDWNDYPAMSVSEGYVYSYDGCDVNSNLSSPDSITVYTKGEDGYTGTNNAYDPLFSISWTECEGAVGYVYQMFAGDELLSAFYSSTLYDSGNLYSIPETKPEVGDTVTIRVCAVDINGDRSDWTEIDYVVEAAEEVEYNANIHFDGNTLRWNRVSGADHYLVKVSDGITAIVDTCFANDSAAILYLMTDAGYAAGDYTFKVFSVDADGVETSLGNIVHYFAGNTDQPTEETIRFEGDVLNWPAVEGADHYIVKVSDGAVTVTDYCFSNNSSNYKSIMAEAGFASGTYTLNVYSVDIYGTETFVDSIEYQFAAGEAGENTFTYSDNGDGTATITGGVINDPNVIIPATIDGLDVVAVGGNAFDFEPAIRTLTISEGIERLEWYAFNTCMNLTQVTLPSTLKHIDGWAFERCYSLKTINIPASVETIFAGAFAQNDNMTSITCDEGNKNYVSVDGVLFTTDMNSVVAYPGGIKGAYTVPASVHHLEDASFYGAKGLESVTILGDLDYIGFEAFAECEMLTDVKINDGVTYVGYWAFRGCDGIKQITVPQSVVNIGDRAFGYSDYETTKVDGFSLRGYKDSAIYFYALRHDIPFVSIGDVNEDNQVFIPENSTETEVNTNPDADVNDSIVSVKVTPAPSLMDKSKSGVGLDISRIKVKANEIYDEEGIARAEAALGRDIVANNKYNILDITLYNDEVDISNKYDGLVEVVIPIPNGHRDKEFYCYRLNSSGEKEIIPGKRLEDSYVIYLEHFSTYAFVAGASHTCKFGTGWSNDANQHWHECSCGAKSDVADHTAGDWIYDLETNSKHKECSTCGYVMEEMEIEDSDIRVTKGLAVGGESKVAMAWTAVPLATAYRVRRKDTGSWKTLANITETAYTDTDVTGDTTYYYAVYALVGDTWNAPATTFEVTTVTIKCVPPTNVKAEAGDSVVDITWDEVHGATAYRVRRNDGKAWTTLGNVTTTSYKDTAVTNGTKYTYGVFAQVKGEWSAASELVTATPEGFECVPPTNVKATAGDSVIDITWDEVRGATAYRVRRHDGTKWATLANVTATSYKDTAVTNGTKYTYGILAQVNGTWSAASTLVAATPAAPYECVPPTGVKATVGDSVVNVTWNAVEGATAYRVRRHDGTKWATLANVTTTSYKDTAVTNGTKYTYGILAQVNGTWSAASTLVAATPAAPFECVPPTGVKATGDDGVITVTWNAVEGATAYRVRRNDGSAWATLANVTATSYKDTAVTNGTKYTYGIFAQVNGKWSTASALVAATPEAIECIPPASVTIKSESGKVSLNWSAVNGATKYRVRRSDGNGWTNLASVSATSYIDSSVTNGTNYVYGIFAYVEGAWSAASALVQAKPAAVIDGVANGLTITTTADSITLSWDAVDGAEKYRVRRSDGVAWATKQTSAKTTFVDTDVVAGTTYKYSIYCYSDGAFGAPSSTVAAIL